MLVLALSTVVPAWLFWDETWILQTYAAGFTCIYLWMYWRIVRFATPWGLAQRGTPRKTAPQRPPNPSNGTL
jgi:hypothetical protein